MNTTITEEVSPEELAMFTEMEGHRPVPNTPSFFHIAIGDPAWEDGPDPQEVHNGWY